MAAIAKILRDFVRDRAAGRCEYCRIFEALFDEPFWIDHIRAEQHGGETNAENLAFCCMRCNRHKGPNLAGHDSVSGEDAFLFNPRKDSWSEHFEWVGAIIRGKTPAGRATVMTLNMNHPTRVEARAMLMEEGHIF